MNALLETLQSWLSQFGVDLDQSAWLAKIVVLLALLALCAGVLWITRPLLLRVVSNSNNKLSKPLEKIKPLIFPKEPTFFALTSILLPLKIIFILDCTSDHRHKQEARQG